MKNTHSPDLLPIGLLLFIFLFGITSLNLLNVLSGSFPAEVVSFLKVPKAMILIIYFGLYFPPIILAIVAGPIISWIAKKRRLDIHVTGTLIQYALFLTPAAATANKSFYWYARTGNDGWEGPFFLIAAIVFYAVVFSDTFWRLFSEVKLATNNKYKNR